MIRWISRLEEAVGETTGLFSPLVWIVRHADAQRWALPPAEAADLADAALAKREGGGGRVLRRRLLRALAARVFAMHPADVHCSRDASGRPGLEAPAAFISTTSCRADGEAISAVALSPGPIGVDLEAGDDAAALTRWTLTEAYLKALGRGLDRPPETVCVERRAAVEEGWRLSAPGAPAAKGETLIVARLIASAAWVEQAAEAGSQPPPELWRRGLP